MKNRTFTTIKCSVVSLMTVLLLLFANTASAQTNAKHRSTPKATPKTAAAALNGLQLQAGDSACLQRIIAYQGRLSATDTQPNAIRTMFRALERHPFAVHADVRLTSDDKLILYASDVMEGLYIPDSPYQLLADHPAFREAAVPLLKEYLIKGLQRLSRQEYSSTSILLEIHPGGNGEYGIRLADQLADLLLSLGDMDAQKHVIIASPDFTQCELLRRRLSHVCILYQGSDMEPDKLLQAGMSGLYCDMKAYYQHPDWAVVEGDKNFLTAVQPVRNEGDWAKLMSFGVRYMATDDAARLISVMQKK